MTTNELIPSTPELTRLDELNLNNEKLQNLIKQINELIDQDKANDTINWVFDNNLQNDLDEWLSEALDKCDISIIDILINTIDNILSRIDSGSLEVLSDVKESIIHLKENLNKIKEKKNTKLTSEYEIKTWNMDISDLNNMRTSLNENEIFIEKTGESNRYKYNPKKLKSFLKNKKNLNWSWLIKLRKNELWTRRAVVLAIQLLLNEKFPEELLLADWKYGKKTESKVREFQNKYNLTHSNNQLKVDGKAWINTITALLEWETDANKHEAAVSIWSKEIDDNKINSEPLKSPSVQSNAIEIITWLWIDINEIENIEDINQFTEIDLEIIKVNSETFYQWYDYTKEEIESHHHYKRWRIIENIQKYIQNVINENREIGEAEIIENIRSDLVTLPIKEKINIIKWVHKVVEKFNTVHWYLEFNNWPYESPKWLLCAIQWITNPSIISKISDNITVKQYWTWLTFFVWDEESYKLIFNKGDWGSSVIWWWFNTKESAIPDLEWTLSVINWEEPEDLKDYSYWAIFHELQHLRNSYFMSEYDEWPLIYAKDEITAYLRDWRWVFNIEKRDDTIVHILTSSWNEWWLYQYNLSWAERENHQKQIIELLTYVNDLIELTKDPISCITREIIISMLSDTPVNEWKALHSNIMKSINNHDNNLLSEEFWRAWTAKKETTINEILVSNSIEEIKYILRDPKYSHITRAPNNKWWIEIAAIIDNVMEWELEITTIPTEIRPRIEELMKK